MKKRFISLCLFLLALGGGASAQNASTATCAAGESSCCGPHDSPCCTSSCCAEEKWQGTVVVGNKTYNAAATLHLTHATPYALVSIKKLGVNKQRFLLSKQPNGKLLFTTGAPSSLTLVSARQGRVL